MGKIYKVLKVFDDAFDKRTRYAENSIVSFDDEIRVSDLIERGLIKEFEIESELNNDKFQISESCVNIENISSEQDNDESDKKNKTKGKGEK